MSMTPTPLPSRCAAMPRMPPMVTMPVPPPGDNDVVGLAELRMRGLRQRHHLLVAGDALALLQLRAVHGDERGAEPLHAGVVLVAGRLVDGALPAELGLQRLHRDAVRLHAAVAAALADELVDDDALLGIGERAALSSAALLGGAGLVVDQNGAAGDFAKLPLHGLQVVAVMEGDALGPFGPGGYFFGSSLTTTTRLAPSAATWAAIFGTERLPSFIWPPVMATASL